ncbi:MAG: phosphatase PAP2 family protein [Mangrovibacterium sp.]
MNRLFDSILSLDKSLFLSLNGQHNPFWDATMVFFTGTGIWMLFYLSIIWFILKRYRSKALVIIFLLALSILISDQMSGLVKDTVQRLRPTHDPGISQLVHHVVTQGGTYGFFSSHASNSFATAMFTALLFRNRRYSLLIFFWACMISYTRIYLGLHYPGDLLAGMLFGLLVGYGCFKLLVLLECNYLTLSTPKLTEIHLKEKEFWYIFLVFSVTVLITLLIASRMVHYNWI